MPTVCVWDGQVMDKDGNQDFDRQVTCGATCVNSLKQAEDSKQSLVSRGYVDLFTNQSRQRDSAGDLGEYCVQKAN